MSHKSPSCAERTQGDRGAEFRCQGHQNRVGSWDMRRARSESTCIIPENRRSTKRSVMQQKSLRKDCGQWQNKLVSSAQKKALDNWSTTICGLEYGLFQVFYVLS